jgi:hypothetical protein
MEHLGFTQSNTISDKMEINLHVLRSLVLYWVG